MATAAVMQTGAITRDPAKLFPSAGVTVERRDDGALILRSSAPLPPTPRCVGEWLVHWAKTAPERDFLCERTGPEPGSPWRRMTYSMALARVEAIATFLLRARLSAETPIMVLSENSIEHGLLSLAASHTGIPIASVSPAYSLMSKDHAKLKGITRALSPGVIYVADGAQFSSALAAIADLHEAKIIAGKNASGAMLSFADLLADADAARVAQAFARVTPDTIAKILFTSGSTGEPKGVINTQRMLTYSQEAKAWEWPFIAWQPPVVLDWLPWSHTFGANHNFNLILRNGGTLYIDGGRPAPALFHKTIENLRDVACNISFNVPAAYALLVQAMRKDATLRDAFFAHLQVVFYAAAALPQNVWNDLRELALESVGEPVVLVSGWGSTETAPLATDCYFQAERSGNIGVPAPGVTLKLVPNGDKLEIRVRGANVTPGYWRRDDLTRAAFDDEGFYRIGDAVRFADPQHPEKGLYFDGRVSEDFKLTSGTWVSVGQLRMKGIECLAPVAQDIVVAGQDRDRIGFLVFANLAACRQLAGDDGSAAPEQVLTHPEVLARLRAGLSRMRTEGIGSSTHAACALLMAEPPSVDAGEITDKGYINQRAVLQRRSDLVERLYNVADDGIIAL
jgi:feruloyl-CoA synthase